MMCHLTQTQAAGSSEASLLNNSEISDVLLSIQTEVISKSMALSTLTVHWIHCHCVRICLFSYYVIDEKQYATRVFKIHSICKTVWKVVAVVVVVLLLVRLWSWHLMDTLLSNKIIREDLWSKVMQLRLHDSDHMTNVVCPNFVHTAHLHTICIEYTFWQWQNEFETTQAHWKSVPLLTLLQTQKTYLYVQIAAVWTIGSETLTTFVPFHTN